MPHGNQSQANTNPQGRDAAIQIINPTPPKAATRLGSSPSLAMARKLIADFYYTTAERIDLTAEPAADTPTAWAVSVGGKAIATVVVVKQRGRFVFQTKTEQGR